MRFHVQLLNAIIAWTDSVVFRLLLVLLRFSFFVFRFSHYLFSYGTVW